MRKTALLVAASFLCTVQGAAAQDARAPTSIAAAEQRWSDWARAGDIRGLGVALIQDDAVTTTYIGDRRRGEAPVDDRTVFEAASLSKPVVAYLALRLVDQGKLDLDTPLVDLVPGLPVGTDAGIAALDAAVRRWPDIAIPSVTSWVAWALDTRGLTDAKATLEAWSPPVR